MPAELAFEMLFDSTFATAFEAVFETSAYSPFPITILKLSSSLPDASTISFVRSSFCLFAVLPDEDTSEIDFWHEAPIRTINTSVTNTESFWKVKFGFINNFLRCSFINHHYCAVKKDIYNLLIQTIL